MRSCCNHLKYIFALHAFVVLCIPCKAINDSLKAFHFITISKQWLSVDVDSAMCYADSCLALANSTKSVYLRAMALDQQAVALEKIGNWNKAILYLNEAIELRKEGGWYLQAGQSYLHLGNLYFHEGEVYELTSSFDLADSSFYLALENYSIGLSLISLKNDFYWMGQAYMNIGSANFKLFADDKALSNYKQARWFFVQLLDSVALASVNSNIGLIFQNKGDLDSASYYFLEARSYFIEQNNLKNWVNTNLNLASVWEHKDPSKAIGYLQEADSLALELNNNVQRSIIQEYLYRLYAEQGDDQNALLHLEEYVALKDSLLSSDFKSEELNVRYETARQKELIEKQKNENLRKELALSRSRLEKQILWVGLTLALLVVGSLLGLGWYKRRVNNVIQKQREKINTQQIEQLKKEQAVKTIEALLQGQEKERGRISEDLHDRLGSTLSAVRMQIEAYGENNVQNVERLLSLMDRAIEETRSISHNLVSGVLARFGLVAALEELQENFNVSQRVRVHLKVGEFASMKPEMEIEIFRIIQEIVSNALRHSNAENIWINANLVGDDLIFEVRDDGDGFDLEEKSSGIGLKNISTRVSRLKGKLNIASHFGGGTCFKIQIPVENETNKHLNC